MRAAVRPRCVAVRKNLTQMWTTHIWCHRFTPNERIGSSAANHSHCLCEFYTAASSVSVDAKTRRDRIEQRVRSEFEVGYAELATEFDVSEMTIRRDVEALEALGVVRRVVGGAIAVKGKDAEPSFATRVADAAEEKRHIADAVADLVSH